MLNNQSKLWAKVLNIGINNDHLSRCKASLTSRYKPIPVMSGLRKDHKAHPDPTEGPPVRPVCRANDAPNAPLGNIIGQVIKGASQEMADRINTASISTEEVCGKVIQTNNQVKERI